MNILIIDDEPLIRNSIYQKISGMNINIDNVYLAEGPDTARKILKDHTVDIFLCDIVMPVEDGISFAKWAIEHYPNSKFIFLTAHSDFLYMREAILMQSFDYILQPMELVELKKALERAILQINLEKRKRELESSNKLLMDNEEDILEEYSKKYLFDNFDKEEYFIEYLKKTAGFDAGCGIFIPFYMQIQKSENNWEGYSRLLMKLIYSNVIDEIMEPLHLKSVVFLQKDPGSDVIILLHSEQSDQNDADTVTEKLETMQVSFRDLMHVNYAIYQGNFCSLENLRETVRKLVNEVQKIAGNASRVYRFDGKQTKSDFDFPEIDFHMWHVLINENKILEFRENLFAYLKHCSEKGVITFEYLSYIHQQISKLILNIIASNELVSEDVFDEECSYYDFMYCAKSLAQFKAIIGTVLERLALKLQGKYRDPITDMIRYIQGHINQDLRVNELAERAGITPEYLTRLFKKSVGINLKQYIVEEKMKHAKFLLKTTNLSVTAISEHVGYMNYSNFSHAFKLMFGSTPSEYRISQRDM